MGPHRGGAEYGAATIAPLPTEYLQWDRTGGARNTCELAPGNSAAPSLQWDRTGGGRNTCLERGRTIEDILLQWDRTGGARNTG